MVMPRIGWPSTDLTRRAAGRFTFQPTWIGRGSVARKSASVIRDWQHRYLAITPATDRGSCKRTSDRAEWPGPDYACAHSGYDPYSAARGDPAAQFVLDMRADDFVERVLCLDQASPAN